MRACEKDPAVPYTALGSVYSGVDVTGIDIVSKRTKVTSKVAFLARPVWYARVDATGVEADLEPLLTVLLDRPGSFAEAEPVVTFAWQLAYDAMSLVFD